MEKTYLAIVRGRVNFEETTVDGFLTQDTASPIRIKQKMGGTGKASRTHFRCLRRWGDLSLVECRPETGRKHQLRVHLDSLGYPILGDKLYGQDPEVFLSLLAENDPEKSADLDDLQERLGHPRHCLHAHELSFALPGQGAFKFTAPLNLDMRELLDHMGESNQTMVDSAPAPAAPSWMTLNADRSSMGRSELKLHSRRRGGSRSSPLWSSLAREDQK